MGQLGQQGTSRLFTTLSLSHEISDSWDSETCVDNAGVSFDYYPATQVDNDFTIAYIGLGSNLGDRAGNLLMAVRGLMEASFHVNKLSGIYETEPVEIESDSYFLNMVAEIHVKNVTPSQMMARLLRIEYLLGRTDKALNKPRTADLDILFFGHTQMESDFLIIPHPRLHLRRFVLKPLSKIAPNFVHPVLQKEIADLLAECEDTSEVIRWKPV